ESRKQKAESRKQKAESRKQKAVLIPVICRANNVRHAFDIYQEKVSDHSTFINENKVIKVINI
ncbi:hypothetical protein, partial [Vibrio sp.]|uniref:hypothetical protein n=1 Tax=Vibrio sp. TaxID=678 RepID=UPI00311FBF00